MSKRTGRAGILALIAIGAPTALLLGSGVATAAPMNGFSPNPTPSATPSERPAAGPEAKVAAGSRPVSGDNPEAGPTFTQGPGGVWQVNTSMAVLRNTVTDADGDQANLTFEVWTTDADGNPQEQVNLTDDNPYGVLVSDYVASGGTAEVTVPSGRLTPGATYIFHTSAYDGSLYETSWSPWATFQIRHRVVDIQLPEPDTDQPTLNQDDFQNPQEIAMPVMTEVDPEEPGTRSIDGREGWNCGKVNEKTGIRPCTRIVPNDSEKPHEAPPSTRSADPVAWCDGLADAHIKRLEACIASFTYDYIGIVVENGVPTGEILNASWAIQQQYKLANNSEFIYEKMTIFPVGSIDAKFVSVTLDVEFNCLLGTDCTTDTRTTAWEGALEWVPGDLHTAEGTITHKWDGAAQVGAADLLNLSAKITAYSRVTNPAASRWRTAGAEIRCDTISRNQPGCTFHKYIPTWTFNTKKFPVATAHAWLVQAKLPNHPGSKQHNKPMFFLPGASKNAHNRPPKENRKVICPDRWAREYGHPETGLLTDISSTDAPSCDEFAFAASYNSGGMPTSMGAFSSHFSQKYRLLDQDPYWVDTPGFEHCDATAATVRCTVPDP